MSITGGGNNRSGVSRPSLGGEGVGQEEIFGGAKFTESSAIGKNFIRRSGGIKARLTSIGDRLTSIGDRVVKTVEKRLPSLKPEQVYSQNYEAAYSKKVSKVSAVFSKVSEILKGAKKGVKTAGKGFKNDFKKLGGAHKIEGSIINEAGVLATDLLKGLLWIADYVNHVIDGISDIEKRVRKELSTTEGDPGKDEHDEHTDASTSWVSSKGFIEESKVFKGVVDVLLKEANAYIKSVSKEIDKIDGKVRGRINEVSKGAEGEISEKINTRLKAARVYIKEVGKALKDAVVEIGDQFHGDSFGAQKRALDRSSLYLQEMTSDLQALSNFDSIKVIKGKTGEVYLQGRTGKGYIPLGNIFNTEEDIK